MKPHSRGGIVSVGYEGRTVDELVGCLAAHHVEQLADVRLNAVSRFSKRRLAAAVAEAAIVYRHIPQLGNLVSNRDSLRRGEPAALARYLQHLRSVGAGACRELLGTVAGTTVALLCFERDHRRCHRACIIDAVSRDVPGLRVTILD